MFDYDDRDDHEAVFRDDGAGAGRRVETTTVRLPDPIGRLRVP